MQSPAILLLQRGNRTPKHTIGIHSLGQGGTAQRAIKWHCHGQANELLGKFLEREKVAGIQESKRVRHSAKVPANDGLHRQALRDLNNQLLSHWAWPSSEWRGWESVRGLRRSVKACSSASLVRNRHDTQDTCLVSTASLTKLRKVRLGMTSGRRSSEGYLRPKSATKAATSAA